MSKVDESYFIMPTKYGGLLMQNSRSKKYKKITMNL